MIRIEETAPLTHERRDILVTDGTTHGTVPIHMVVGERHHPCLALVAGVHGDEYDGVLGVQEVAREVRAAELKGSLILIPVANPFAFAAAQRHTPQDGKDLNRVFPGRADGSLSECLAHQLCMGVLYQADLVFTLHGGDARSALAPWVEFLDVPTSLGQASYEAARVSGFSDLIALPPLPGRLLTAMAGLGVPLIEGEVGGRGTTQRENVAYYKERVYNIARHASVLHAPAPAPVPGPRPRIWLLCPVPATATGILLRAIDLLEQIEEGDCLGAIIDMQGETAAALVAPVGGVVGAYREHVGVQAGEPVVTLWSPAEARIYA